MCQNFERCYSTLSNMRAYGRECQNFYTYFIQFSSLLPTHLSSNNNFRVSQGALQALDSAAVLSGDHFKFHFNTLSSPSSSVPWRRQIARPRRRPVVPPHAHAGLFSIRDSSLMLGVTSAGFDGSPTSDAFRFFDLGWV